MGYVRLFITGIGIHMGLLAPLAIAKEFSYNRYRSPANLGRGDTGIAASKDEDAPYYNPALIGFGAGIYKKLTLGSIGLELSLATRDAIREIVLQEGDYVDTLRKSIGVPQHFGANIQGPSLILRRAAITTYGTSSNHAMIQKAASARGLETISIDSTTTAGLGFHVAQDFASVHSIGVSARYEMKSQINVEVNATDGQNLQNMSGSESGRYAMSGVGYPVDIGYLFKLKELYNAGFGLTIKDVLGTKYIPSTTTTLDRNDWALKNNKRTLNLGFSIEPGTKDSKLLVLADLLDVANAYEEPTFKKLHLGTELSLKNVLGITAGINQGYPTFGAYLDLRLVRFDLGRYTEEVGTKLGERPDTRFYFRVAAGF